MILAVNSLEVVVAPELESHDHVRLSAAPTGFNPDRLVAGNHIASELRPQRLPDMLLEILVRIRSAVWVGLVE